MSRHHVAERLADVLALPPGPVDLAKLPTGTTPGFDGGKRAGKRALAELAPTVSNLQERLFAEGHTGGTRSLLLVLQGMDTSGKGGTLRHSVGLVDPQGVRITSFKAPTRQELRHDFLWRIRKALPEPGYLGIFDRSHYEDVLVARVHELVPPETWTVRYDVINEFERELSGNGVTVVKCFLHLSKKEQKKRLAARLEDPTKYWKYNPGDVDERARWEDYQVAYAAALERTNTDAAPWYVVPADRKWYRNLAITKLLVERLSDLDPKWPTADYDVQGELTRLNRT
ncbi:polyphosphate kinase 2 family protein [Actinopolymorpha rutila]|uniref:PPK2 family polyphosphate:nucleotide phosphotransferase n=1 Tax=Actinopolymorpha rutila TaxID=446787 RepID=A0A852ZEB5_9ACTN|nr:polyphosphate kinase 2 family protein [Actinopolymorpha rutila]NYH90633.1 PPK2 family polyphosphate:nucleotide phosphotransferase [Actinopolymorpha rutila]